MRLFLLFFLFLFNSSVFSASPTYIWVGSNEVGRSSDPLQACIQSFPAITTYDWIISNPHSAINTSYSQRDCKSIMRGASSGVIRDNNYTVGYINLLSLCPDGTNPDTSKPFDKQCPDPDPCKLQAGNKTGDMTVSYTNASISSIKSLVGQTTKFNVKDTQTGSLCEVSGSISDCGLLGTIAFCTVKDGALTGNPEYKAESTDFSGSNPTQCKKGQCPGQVNGVDVCVACTAISSDTGTGSSSTTQKADGSTVKTDSKSTTTCEGGSCNTTTTTTNTTINPDGSTGGTETKTDTKTEAKETFCKENPTFTACIPSGFSASACGAAPSCTGDAIQCAIAQQQHKSYCELMATPTAISELGVAVANGEAIPADHPLAQAEASPFNFSSAFTGASGGGGCPADVMVMGVTVPLSTTCEGLNALGLAALGISLIWAARVVFAG